jgi:hypothetical protein
MTKIEVVEIDSKWRVVIDGEVMDDEFDTSDEAANTVRQLLREIGMTKVERH